jgi:hypothetical protein
MHVDPQIPACTVEQGTPVKPHSPVDSAIPDSATPDAAPVPAIRTAREQRPYALQGKQHAGSLGAQRASGHVFKFLVNAAKKGLLYKAVLASLLIDTGATDNFLNAKLCTALGLKVYPVSLHATMGNGSRMAITGYCYVTVDFGTFTDEVRCYVADVGDLDLILGDAWLVGRKAVISYAGPEPTLRVQQGRRRVVMVPTAGDFAPVLAAARLEASTAKKPVRLQTAREFRRFKGDADERMFCVKLKHVVQDVSDATDADDGPSTSGQDDLMTDAVLQQILSDFKPVFQDELPGVAAARPFVKHHTIPLMQGSRPPSSPLGRLSPLELAEVETHVKMLLQKGLIRPSHSPYGARVVFASKPDGSLRMCIDYRALNNITEKNSFPIPRIDDLLDKLQGSTIFSALDLTSGYWQIPLSEEDIHKTAFRTPAGLFEWNVLPFGLTNAPASFQATMNAMLQPLLGTCALVYLDDILIFSKSPAEHEQHLRAVLTLLQQNNFYCKMKKCVFNQSEVKYLGHIVGRRGVRVEPGKCKVVQDWPQPRSAADVRAFLGLATYFRKFIQGYSMRAAPLTDILKGAVMKKSRKGQPRPPDPNFVWTPVAQAAFLDIKQALVSAPVLVLPDHTKPFTVICDASLEGVGAVLVQDGHAVAFESHKFTPAERNYSTTDQEMLAVVRALDVWRVYLEGVPFTVMTDHNPNTYFNTKKDLSRRQARWAELFSRFHFDWKYIEGKSNAADPLSRLRHTATLSMLSLYQLGLYATTRGKTRVTAPRRAADNVPVLVSPAQPAEISEYSQFAPVVDDVDRPLVRVQELTEIQQHQQAAHCCLSC